MSGKNKEKNNDYKFLVIGDRSVGKTSIFKKITTDIFSEKNISTIGMDKRTLYFNDIEVKINEETKKADFSIILLDTAGQERYHSITKTYFQGSDGIIVLYDITSKKSFEGVGKWLDSITQTLSHWNTAHYVVTLVGNKFDLVDNGDKEREVEVEEAEKICLQKQIYFAGEYSVKNSTTQELTDILIKTWKNYVEKFGLKKEISTQIRMEGSKYKKKINKNCFC